MSLRDKMLSWKETTMLYTSFIREKQGGRELCRWPLPLFCVLQLTLLSRSETFKPDDCLHFVFIVRVMKAELGRQKCKTCECRNSSEGGWGKSRYSSVL